MARGGTEVDVSPDVSKTARAACRPLAPHVLPLQLLLLLWRSGYIWTTIYSPPMILSVCANDLNMQGLDRKGMIGRTEVGNFWEIGHANLSDFKHMAKNDKPSLNHHQI